MGFSITNGQEARNGTKTAREYRVKEKVFPHPCPVYQSRKANPGGGLVNLNCEP